jgi:predicted enzyme related to lactoylglutathione lyase
MRSLNIFVLSLTLLVACGRNRVRVPTITDDRDGKYLYGKFVWHDLVTDNVPAARDFYGQLFGWEFEGRGGDGAPYLNAVQDDIPIAGIVKTDRLQEQVNESRWISYISVPDVDKVASHILNSGGLIYKAPMELEVRGHQAIVGDNSGAAFGIITANGGDPLDSGSKEGTWLWDELVTDYPQDVVTFYASIAGYEISDMSDGNPEDYYILSIEGKQRAGITSIPWENAKPNWLPYIMVNDLSTKISQAEGLGVRSIIAPDQNIQNGNIGILADPTGAVFGLQKWPL